MMNKEFDCIKMKYQIQEKLSNEYKAKKLSDYVMKIKMNIKSSQLLNKINENKRALVNH